MMKAKLAILGALASLFTIGAAGAADLPSRKEPPAYVPPPPAFSWTGWRVGVNGGWAGGDVTSTAVFSAFPVGGAPGFATGATTNTSLSGGIVGGQNSFLWELPGHVVLGYESDFQWSGVTGQRNDWFGGLATRGSIDWFGTERARFGYAFGRILPYVTAGLAYGQLRSNVGQAFGNAAFWGSRSTTQAGWVAGGGVEYAFTDHISVKAEYLYMQLQGVRGYGAGVAVGPTGAAALAPYQFNTGVFGTHIARAGVNYKIDSLGGLLGIAGLPF